jgi:tRNA pseudouridine55 synthase
VTPAQPGIVVVDKPAGMTSHDVVGRCRRIFGTRKVGHAGTLDPMATGVLVIGIERATKILGLITATSKSYAATIRLGRTTTTDDAEGDVIADHSAAQVSDDAINAGIAVLRGEISQRPSAVSAIKVGGKRAYQLVREGEEVELAARTVRIDRFDALAIRREGPFVDVDVEVDCSSGTYIRALARDLGSGLRADGREGPSADGREGPSVGGHLTALRRTRVGGYGLDHARTLDELAEQPSLSYSLDEACLLAFPRRDITAAEAEDAGHGRPLSAAGIEGVYAATDPDGRVMALLADHGPRTRSVVVIRPATL